MKGLLPSPFPPNTLFSRRICPLYNTCMYVYLVYI